MTTRITVLSLALLALGASDASAVVGGKPADPADYPFFAVVGGGCGGALIAPDRVLTAAHCRDALIGKRYVLVGPARRRVAVRRIAIHPVSLSFPVRSDAQVTPGDLMLLELAAPVTDIAPLDIAASPPAAGTPAVTVGRGTTDPGKTSDRKLRFGPVQVYADSRCKRELAGKGFREWFVCVRDPRSLDKSEKPPFVSGCFGDSGSPLLVRDGLKWVTVGVDSWGPACGTDRDPELYADAVLGRPFALAPSPVWAPAPAAPPVVSGALRVGGRVTCSVRFLDAPRKATYEFKIGSRFVRDTRTYTIRERDRGKKISCFVFAEGKGGTEVAQSRTVRIAG
jgi:Trypsin